MLEHHQISCNLANELLDEQIQELVNLRWSIRDSICFWMAIFAVGFLCGGATLRFCWGL